jgi:hypothetical protein
MITAIPTTPTGRQLLTPAMLAILDECNSAETVLHDALADAKRCNTVELPWYIQDRIMAARRDLRAAQGMLP